MIKDIRVAPPSSVILVMDQTTAEVPESMNRRIVSATGSCIAVGTLSQADGDTFVSLSDEVPRGLPNQPPAFDGVVSTPTRTLSVCSVEHQRYLVLGVSATSTRVRIWVNHPAEPNEIWIVVGGCSRRRSPSGEESVK
jgi:hypothetical protein